MIRTQLTIKNQLGLHARAGAKLVDTAKRFGSRIEITFRDRTIDAKSIMGVITLGAKKDHLLDLAVEGEDEQEAHAAIAALIEGKFGEE